MSNTFLSGSAAQVGAGAFFDQNTQLATSAAELLGSAPRPSMQNTMKSGRLNAALYSLIEPTNNVEVHIPDARPDNAIWKQVRTVENFPVVFDGVQFLIVVKWESYNANQMIYVFDGVRFAPWKYLVPDNVLSNNFSLVRPWSGAVQVFAQTTPGGSSQGTITAATIQSPPASAGAMIANLTSSTLAAIPLDDTSVIANTAALQGIICLKPPGGALAFLPQRTQSVTPVNSRYATTLYSTVAGSGWLSPASALANIYFNSASITTGAAFIPPNEVGAVRIRGIINLTWTAPQAVGYATVTVAVSRRVSTYPAAVASAVVVGSYQSYVTSYASALASVQSVPFDVYDAAFGTLEAVTVVVAGGTTQHTLGPASTITLDSVEDGWTWENSNMSIAIVQGLSAGQNVVCNITQGYEVIPDARLAANVAVSHDRVDDILFMEQIEQTFRIMPELGLRYAYLLSDFQRLVSEGFFRRIAMSEEGKTRLAASFRDLLKYVPTAVEFVGDISGHNKAGRAISGAIQPFLAAPVAGLPYHQASTVPLPRRFRAADAEGEVFVDPFEAVFNPAFMEVTTPCHVYKDAGLSSFIICPSGSSCTGAQCPFMTWRPPARPTKYRAADRERSSQTAVQAPRRTRNRTQRNACPNCRCQSCTGSRTTHSAADTQPTTRVFYAADRSSGVDDTALSQRPVTIQGRKSTLRIPDELTRASLAEAALVHQPLVNSGNPRVGYTQFVVLDPADPLGATIAVIAVTPMRMEDMRERYSLAKYTELQVNNTAYYYTYQLDQSGQPIAWDDFETLLRCVLMQLESVPSCAIHIFLPGSTSGSSGGTALYFALSGVVEDRCSFTGGFVLEGDKCLRSLIDVGDQKILAAGVLIGMKHSVAFKQTPQTIHFWWQLSPALAFESTPIYLPFDNEAQALLFFLRDFIMQTTPFDPYLRVAPDARTDFFAATIPQYEALAIRGQQPTEKNPDINTLLTQPGVDGTRAEALRNFMSANQDATLDQIMEFVTAGSAAGPPEASSYDKFKFTIPTTVKLSPEARKQCLKLMSVAYGTDFPEQMEDYPLLQEVYTLLKTHQVPRAWALIMELIRGGNYFDAEEALTVAPPGNWKRNPQEPRNAAFRAALQRAVGHPQQDQMDTMQLMRYLIPKPPPEYMKPRRPVPTSVMARVEAQPPARKGKLGGQQPVTGPRRGL